MPKVKPHFPHCHTEPAAFWRVRNLLLGATVLYLLSSRTRAFCGRYEGSASRSAALYLLSSRTRAFCGWYEGPAFRSIALYLLSFRIPSHFEGEQSVFLPSCHRRILSPRQVEGQSPLQ